ncbi:MAG: UvrD-helicase domain-containing protein [Archangium sp.]|nr:UvrD-helicase domain-containing protein [Archangium sp.]
MSRKKQKVVNVDQFDLFSPLPAQRGTADSRLEGKEGQGEGPTEPTEPPAELVLDLKFAEVRPSPQPSPPTGGEGDTGEISLPAGLRLERNLAILAGAGAGKTYSLVTMCLHLLGGARTGFPPIACAELGLLTFTEKAADEMRSRLRERLDALAEGRGDEPSLKESFEAADLPFPQPRKWRAIRDELGAATIGTFHSLCTQLLRRAPPNSGVFPHFELLDERDARVLLRDLVERTLLGRVERGSPLRQLVAEIGFGRLVEGLVPIATRIREEGISPDYVPVADGPTLRALFASQLEALKALVRNAPITKPHQLERHPGAVRAVLGLTWDTGEAGLQQLGEALKKVNGWQPLRDAAEALSQIYGACLVAPFEAEVRELLVDVATAHEEALASRGVLDFTGLLVQSRNLLRDYPEARADAQKRFKALLVDEFQDTNRLQLELVLLLAERREGAPRPVSQAFEVQHREIVQLPQEPGFLAIVGDRKQSIYEFRGADVSVFEVMARAIEANGGGRAYLRHSRRSTAPLLAALNAGFTQVLGPRTVGEVPADFEVVYVPEHDDLSAVRTGAPQGVPLLQLEDSRVGPDKRSAELQRNADAEAVSRAVSHGLGGAWTVMEAKTHVERPARGGDVAMLFQRFTQLEVYRQALVRHGVRHRVVRGRGFYGAQEIVDLASLLAVLADPDDALSLSAVLRSPLVGLTDAEWVGLARPAPGDPGRWGLDARQVLTGVAVEFPAAVLTFRQRYAALREERDRLGLRALLRVVLEVFEYRVAVAAGPFGEQALANLDKLLVLATSRESRGVGVSAFARELLELADEAPKEAQGEVVDELDLEAVTLCTVHQAKGLEWPIVVMPDLPTMPRSENAAVRFDRVLGLSLVRPRATTELRSRSATEISNQLSRRARAENLRLLYVAMTRARDRLVLGLRPPGAPVNTWANDLDAFFALRVAGERPEHLDVAGLAPRKLESAPVLPGSRAEIDALIDQVRAPRPSTTASMVLPVTQLQDLVSCPRRFHFAHQVGLSERPVNFESVELAPRGELDDDTSGDADVRVRGTAAHRLLELTPLSAVGTPALAGVLKELRRTTGLERVAGDDVLGWVERFWSSAFGRSLATATVHRELPFALRLEGGEGPGLVLRGQIDLLVIQDGALVVIDYKTATMPAAAVEPYRFQLGCYALAAQRFVPGKRPVRAGIVFLRDEAPGPHFLPDFDPGQLVAPLARECAGLIEAQRSGQWPGRPKDRCDALGCGYVYRCHP